MTYSKFIKTIKFIFLAISILMLVLIIINNRQNQIKIAGEKFSYTEKIDGSINQVLVEPIFMGLNKKEQPFRVTASKATRFKEESNTFYLENPVGEILIDKDKYFLSGKSGVYDKSIQELKINKISQIVFVFLSIKHNFCISQQFKSTSSTDEPIEIYADNGIEWHKNSKKYVALGNARAVSGGLSLKSDKIEAFYNETKDSSMDIANVIAKRNVVIQDKKMKITGGNFAEYNVKKDYFKVNGSRLKLTSQKNILRSNNKMEYWRSKGVAVATGKAEAQKENEFIVKADRLVWNLYEIDKKITVKKIIGFSNVSIRSNNEVAFSDKGIYNNITEVCKLFGNVRLQRGDSFLTGEYAEVDLKSGISKILPAPKKGPNESKVRALIEKETKN